MQYTTHPAPRLEIGMTATNLATGSVGRVTGFLAPDASVPGTVGLVYITTPTGGEWCAAAVAERVVVSGRDRFRVVAPLGAPPEADVVTAAATLVADILRAKTATVVGHAESWQDAQRRLDEARAHIMMQDGGAA